MFNIGDLAETVQKNCHISDARYAGNYTMCIFLLKMREYYRWENNLPLTQELTRADVGDWLVEREQAWEHYENQTYEPLSMESGLVDPFDADTINAELIPKGYVYSSGYGLYNKPHFFLGKLEKMECHDDIRVVISNCEYARDLVAPPAMILNNTIFIRHESLRRMIWEKIEEWQWKSDVQTPMGRVLAAYSDEQDRERVLDELCFKESHNVMLHEIGEARAGKLLGDRWEQMLAELPRSKAELQIRAVRDHLADCMSTLPALLSDKSNVSLNFYFANFSGLRKQLFPMLMNAYERWVATGDQLPLTEAVLTGKTYWHNVAEKILDNYETHKAELVNHVDEMVEVL